MTTAPATGSVAAKPARLAASRITLADLDALGRIAALGKAFDATPVPAAPATEPAIAPANTPLKHPARLAT